jgi:hypothetical protein
MSQANVAPTGTTGPEGKETFAGPLGTIKRALASLPETITLPSGAVVNTTREMFMPGGERYVGGGDKIYETPRSEIISAEVQSAEGEAQMTAVYREPYVALRDRGMDGTQKAGEERFAPVRYSDSITVTTPTGEIIIQDRGDGKVTVQAGLDAVDIQKLAAIFETARLQAKAVEDKAAADKARAVDEAAGDMRAKFASLL